MSNLLGLPNEILLEIAVDLETKHFHCLALTNRFLYRLFQTRLYESTSNDPLKNVIHKENVAVFRTFVDCGLDVNVVLPRHTGHSNSEITLLAYLCCNRGEPEETGHGNSAIRDQQTGYYYVYCFP
jgi:hypothetical protein